MSINHRRAVLLQLAGAAAAALLPPAVRARTDYPSRLVKLIVPAPPGGSTDVMARAIARAMEGQHNIPVVVENRPGAAGAIGIQAAIIAPPDGYTITLSAADATLIYPMLRKIPPYHHDRDLTPIAQVAYTNFLFVVPGDSPCHSIQEVVEASKRRHMAYSSNGYGSGNHLWMEAFKAHAGATLLHVPYNGAAPAMQALMAGEVDFMITSPASAHTALASGRMRPLAVSSERRLPGFPNVPTLIESGYPGVVMGAWFGVFGPANMPPSIVEKLHTMVTDATQSPEYQKQAEAFMFDTQPVSRTAFAKVISDDTALLKAAIESADLRQEN